MIRTKAGECVMGTAADFQAQHTVLADGNRIRIHPAVCFSPKLDAGPVGTELNLQLLRLQNLDLRTVGVVRLGIDQGRGY